MRLINADALIKRFKELKGSDSLANMFITDVMNEIKKQPTAYDVDKVLEQLKENSFVPGDRIGVSDVKIIMSENAVEIVNSGGIE